MTWPKPDIPIMPKTNKPKILNWFIGFCVYAFFAFTLVWFNRNNEKLWLDFFAYVGVFVLLFIMALAMRVYYYVVKAHEYPEFWASEVEKIHERWHEWANESIAVIDSHFLTPQKITAKDIVVQAGINKDEEFKFSDKCSNISMRYWSIWIRH